MIDLSDAEDVADACSILTTHKADIKANAAEVILELVAEVRRLRNLLASRPALNSGLIEAYSQWTAVVYESEVASKEKS